ncbi:methyl-accepting chemotaxis protein [Vibrio clamense]|uniref:methyl-accepting chemotaxis protein n=1 Tax=Vibrio clamense TaxID=2910254 RepID=UPI003D218088
MRSLLRQFPLYIIVTIIAGIPLTLSIILASLSVIEFKQESSLSSQDQEVVELVILYDNIAHNLAVERGLTAGVLGSKGKAAQVEKLKKQRKVADTHIQALKGFSPVHIKPELASNLMGDVQKQLSRLSEVRRQVDTLRPNLSPFAYYSDLNQLAIDNAIMLLASINNSEIASLGKALTSVVVMKERAGQVRGALNGVFSRGNATAAIYANVQNYISSGNYALRRAKIEMPTQFQQQLELARNSSTWKNVNQIKDSFLSQKSNLNNIDGPDASSWFGLATDQIKLINQVRNQLQTEISTISTEQAIRANNLQNSLLVATIVIGASLLWALVFCVTGLRHRVGSLTTHLGNMSAQRDLSVELNSVGKDEISYISRSINQLTQNIRSLLSDVTSTNNNSTQRLNTIVSNAQELGQSSQSTTAKCANIATAMTELSQSSLEIAASAERALTETDEMKSQVLECQSQSEASFNSVEGLITQINETEACMLELEQDTQSISQIVETISAVSEQTNLLALNAAIEAARAGEHGRGFAVVSSEVRDLAHRSQEATESISKLLEKITTNTNKSVSNMNKSKQASDDTFVSVDVVRESVAKLESVIEQVSEHITSIANSTTEQSKASEDVDKDVDTLSEIADQTGVLANELNTIVTSYKEEVFNVQEQLNKFKLV